MKAESRLGSPPSVIPVKKRKKSKEEKKSPALFINQPTGEQSYAMAPDKKDNKRKGKLLSISKYMIFFFFEFYTNN